MIRISKYHYPYLYEYERLGGSLTAEGKDFVKKYDKEIRKEQNELIEHIFYRGAVFGRDGTKKYIS